MLRIPLAAGRDNIKNSKGKGKVQSSFFDAETVSSEEDTETIVPKARRDAFGPPDLDASPGSVDESYFFNKQQSTRHLQKKHTRTAARAKTVPDPDKVIDVLDDDDDDEIQSASGLDDPKTVQDKRLRTTPNGHSLVTEGGVIELVKKYKRNERKASKPENLTNKMQKRGGTKVKLLVPVLPSVRVNDLILTFSLAAATDPWSFDHGGTHRTSGFGGYFAFWFQRPRQACR